MTNEKSGKLVVRADYIARCAWCGTPYSPDWVVTQSGKMYCSIECQSAEHSGCGKVGGFCLIASGLILLAMFVITGLLSPRPYNSAMLDIFSFAGVFILSGFCILALAIEGSTYKDRKDKYRNTPFLVCEYCNHIPTPGAVVCDNCGASLADADFAPDSWPEWFISPKPTRVFRPCRNCGKSFVYPVLSADGKDRCPKCGKPVGQGNEPSK